MLVPDVGQADNHMAPGRGHLQLEGRQAEREQRIAIKVGLDGPGCFMCSHGTTKFVCLV